MKKNEVVKAFIHKFCKVPDGKHIGKPIKLSKFQTDFIDDVYSENRRTRRAILSIARKNGKTALMACLIIVHLVCKGVAKQNSQIVSGAMSRDQAALVFDLACKMITQDETLSKLIRIIPSKKMLVSLNMNVTFTALAADGKTAQGLSPVFALIDEAGQVVGARSDFISAIETSQGAHDDPLLMYISTQAANDSDYLSIIIDDARESKDPRIVCHVYEADKDCDLLDESQWKKANPAIGTFRSLDDVAEQAKQANRMPSAEASFRNLILNQRVSVHSPFISRSTWMECAGELPPMSDCEIMFGGLDLSARLDLTAFCLVGLYDGKWYIYNFAWTPEEGLLDRAKKDRAQYDVWVNQGHIRTTPSAFVDYSHVAMDIANIIAGCNVRAIAFDAWRWDVMKKEIDEIGLDVELVKWSQGLKSMAPALDTLEGRLLNGDTVHGDNPVLNMCARNSVVYRSPTGERLLDKAKTSGRIDCMQALAMATGISEKMKDDLGDIDGFLSAPLVL